MIKTYFEGVQIEEDLARVVALRLLACGVNGL